MVKHTQTIRWLLPANCLNVFDHSVELALKRLTYLHLLQAQTPLKVFQVKSEQRLCLQSIQIKSTTFKNKSKYFYN